MFRHILDQPPLEATDGPIGVVMTPTRELAMQITKDCKKFAKVLGLRVVCVYGGTGEFGLHFCSFEVTPTVWLLKTFEEVTKSFKH